MRILVVSQFFHPEMGAPAARFGDFGSHLVRAGHDVTVLTTFPNFPQGRIYADHQQRPFARETVGGIDVIRTPILALGGHTPVRKAMLYATFAASSLVQGALRDLKPDIVVGTTPPPTVGYTSMLLAGRFGVPHVLDVRDIWPEAVINAGRVKAGPAVMALHRLNSVVLGRSAAVTTVSDGKKTRLIELGAPAGQTHVIPNGVDLALFDQRRKANGDEAAKVLADAGVPAGAKIVLYAGVFNPPQGLDLVLDAAAARKNAGKDDVHFALIGDGSLREHLKERVAREGLDNVHIGGPVGRELVPALYGRAWAALVILRPRKDTHTVPSKIYECMASQRPVILSAAGEVTRIAANANSGPVSGAGDLDELLSSIESLLADADKTADYGRSGRAYVEQHNDRARLAMRYADVLIAAAG